MLASLAAHTKPLLPDTPIPIAAKLNFQSFLSPPQPLHIQPGQGSQSWIAHVKSRDMQWNLQNREVLFEQRVLSVNTFPLTTIHRFMKTIALKTHSSSLSKDVILILKRLLQSGRKCGVSSQRTCSHFFRLIARILTIFDKKYRILPCCDKRESYLIVLQQNNV